MFGVAAIAGLLMTGSADAAYVSTAHSEHGLVANARITDHNAHHSWMLNLDFVVPQGIAVTSGAVVPSGVDLSRPWVVMSIDSSIPGRSCSAFANPAGYGTGAQRLRPGRASQWAGMYVDVSCPDGSGYDFYRITWNSEKTFAVTNPVALADTSAAPTLVQAAGIRGTVNAVPDLEQTGDISVCGHRPHRGFECFGQHGGGTVRRSTTGVTATIASF